MGMYLSDPPVRLHLSHFGIGSHRVEGSGARGGERRALGGVPREQKRLKEHPLRVIYHQEY